MEYKVDTIWKDYIAFGTNIAYKCYREREDIVIIYNEEKMTIPWHILKEDRLDIRGKTYEDKKNPSLKYRLCYFKWDPSENYQTILDFEIDED
jgi:hypothetical protein|tara:strand:- start:458 stop:736 length:279 start_codon:yes stop_codon:yes gene_type:complete